MGVIAMTSEATCQVQTCGAAIRNLGPLIFSTCSWSCVSPTGSVGFGSRPNSSGSIALAI